MSLKCSVIEILVFQIVSNAKRRFKFCYFYWTHKRLVIISLSSPKCFWFIFFRRDEQAEGVGQEVLGQEDDAQIPRLEQESGHSVDGCEPPVFSQCHKSEQPNLFFRPSKWVFGRQLSFHTPSSSFSTTNFDDNNNISCRRHSSSWMTNVIHHFNNINMFYLFYLF